MALVRNALPECGVRGLGAFSATRALRAVGESSDICPAGRTGVGREILFHQPSYPRIDLDHRHAGLQPPESEQLQRVTPEPRARFCGSRQGPSTAAFSAGSAVSARGGVNTARSVAIARAMSKRKAQSVCSGRNVMTMEPTLADRGSMNSATVSSQRREREIALSRQPKTQGGIFCVLTRTGMQATTRSCRLSCVAPMGWPCSGSNCAHSSFSAWSAWSSMSFACSGLGFLALHVSLTTLGASGPAGSTG